MERELVKPQPLMVLLLINEQTEATSAGTHTRNPAFLGRVQSG